jgi:hypothetical protein
MNVAAAALKYAGSNPIEGATFLGEYQQTVATVGASITSSVGAHLDLGANFGKERTTVPATPRLRF